MEQSLFIDWVAKRFPKLAIQISKDTKDKEPKYYHQRMLAKKFSLDGSWEAIQGEYSNIAADVVNMDSRLDIKSRDSIASASGDIPKVGMMLALTEKQLKKLDTLVASNINGVNDKEILIELFRDLKRCIQGVYNRTELLFLQGLSSGIIVTDREEDASTGIRANFNYHQSHKFGVAFDWADANTATPVDDIDAVLEKAHEDGYSLSVIMLKPKQLNQARRAKQMIAEYAASKDTTSSGAAVSKQNLIQWFKDEKGLTVEEIKTTIPVEKDGKRTNIDPWQDGMIVFLSDMNVGDLVWTKLAEMNHPKQDVTYQIVDDYILASKYHEVNPIKEITSSQAMLLPVISDIGGIYQLDTKDIKGTAENPGDQADNIDLNKQWQQVVSDVKINSNVESLNAALEAEKAKEKPRDSVVKALEERIAELSGTPGTGE